MILGPLLHILTGMQIWNREQNTFDNLTIAEGANLTVKIGNCKPIKLHMH